MIRVYVTFEPRVARTARVYVSVPTDRVGGGGYRRTADVLDAPDLVDQLVEEVRVKLTDMRGAHRHLRVLDPLWDQITAVVSQFMARRAEGKSPSA